MISNAHHVLKLLGASIAVALVGAAGAAEIKITNVTPNPTITLRANSTVQFTAGGDLQIECATGSGGTCTTTNLGGGGTPGTGPSSATLTVPTTAPSGTAFTWSWSSSGAHGCRGVAPAGISGWTNTSLSNSGSLSMTPTAAQVGSSLTFDMYCFNASGVTSAASRSVTITQGSTNPPDPQPGDYCAEYYGAAGRTMPTSPNFTAHGLTRHDVDFSTIWGVSPGGAGPHKAVPGGYMNPVDGKYMVVPFIIPSGVNSVRFQWLPEQFEGYPTGSMSITISPCPGDFRPAGTGGTNDHYAGFACSTTEPGNNGSLTASAVAGQGCLAPTGKQMYLNIAAYNMFGPTLPASTNCPSGQPTCAVAMSLP